jgi:hypothetical protein
MVKLSFVAAVASAMWGAGDGGNAIPSKPEVTLAQSQLDLCVGPDCRYDNWRYYRGGTCRDVTFREERGGEVMIRHVRRCE